MKTPVAIGQLWKDNDSRVMYPYFTIVGFTPDGKKALCKKGREGFGFVTKISISRLRNTPGLRSYTLIKDPTKGEGR